jgi:GT2 family glycosyltransferase
MSAAAAIDVLIPTCHRACALAVTLATLSAQTWRDFRIIVSDQSDAPGAFASAEVAALQRYLAATGIELVALRHLPRLGMAEQRAFLLSRSEAPYCLFLDDDVIVENNLLARMHQAMRAQQCGLVGSAPHGLSHLAAQRPAQQAMQFWDTQVEPERIDPGSAQWEARTTRAATGWPG